MKGQRQESRATKEQSGSKVFLWTVEFKVNSYLCFGFLGKKRANLQAPSLFPWLMAGWGYGIYSCIWSFLLMYFQTQDHHLMNLDVFRFGKKVLGGTQVNS